MTATADITDESTPAEVAVGRAAIDAEQESLEGKENLSADVTAALQGRIDTLESSFSPNEMAVRMAAATAAAGTKVMAIDAEAGETGEADAGLGGSTASAIDAGDEDSYALSIERDRMATTVAGETVTVKGATEDDDVEFMEAMDFGDGRTKHTRTMDADADGNVMTEVVIVSTDIEAPKATAFATVYPFNANPTDATPPVNQSLDIVEGNRAMIATDGITAPGAGTITVKAAVEDDDETETVAAFETDATFDGAPGTLKCAGTADCTVTLDADGEITAFGDGWEFTPADGATVDVADADHLHYGFWLKRTADADGATTYNEVETFAESSAPLRASVSDVDGTAEYNGGAVGVYVKNVFDSKGAIDTATSGHFTADASLTATFGQTVEDEDTPAIEGGTIAPNLINTLSGTINNFQLSGGDENEWSVNLQGGIMPDDGTASGTANGGGAEGSFNATFHGALDTDDPTVTPSSVVGEFNANFGNGTAAGGFGARKQ